MPEPLLILYRDDHLIAIDKPPGLLVHRSDLDRHETRFAVQLLRDQIGRRVQPVHRLDRGTSGVLLFAFEPDVTRALSRQFEAGEVGKTYLAVVRGWPEEEGLIDHALSRRFDDYGRSLPVAPPQAAQTRFQRLATIELPVAIEGHPTSRYAFVALEPLTGRQHQLRRHMKHISHPIIGDATHGRGRHNRYFQSTFGCHRLLLACVGLTFRHPVTGEKVPPAASNESSFANAGDADCRRRVVSVTATVKDQFAELLERFGWSYSPERSDALRPIAS